MSTLDPPSMLRLNGVFCDFTTGTLSGPGGQVRVEPRVMSVLQILSRQPGELVSRSELLAELWPGGDTYDEALTQCIYQLRQQLATALGVEKHELIRTVPKRGYVLDAEIETAVPDQGTVAPVPGSVPGRKTAYFGIAIATAVVLAGSWLWFANARGPVPGANTSDSPVQPASTQTLAVLPFLSLDATPIDPALQLGMADALITQLSGSPELIVRPVSSVRRLVDIDRDALQAGRDLAVDTLLDGSVQQSGDTIRVTARLIRVSDGTAIWADRFDEPFTGIFEVQDAISQRIASALGLRMPLQEHGGTQNLEAYEKYLEGRLNLARLNAKHLELAINYFQEAVTLDPDYALAWLGLANAHFRIPLAGEANPLEHYPVGKAAGMKALELEPLMAEAYAMLGWIAHWYEWDWVASEKYFLRAIELDPNDTEAHLGYAHLLSNQGRHEQAMAEVRRARELSPLHMVAASLEGAFLLGAGQIEEALRAGEQAVRLDPEFWLARMNLAVAMSVSGRIEEGLEQIRIAREISGGGTYPMALEVSFLVMLGRRDEAETVFEEMLLASEQNFVPPYHLAYASAALGKRKEALEWLQRGYEVRDPKLVFLEVLPIWKQLSAEPEFIKLINRMNLPR